MMSESESVLCKIASLDDCLIFRSLEHNDPDPKNTPKIGWARLDSFIGT